jgi:transcription elongation factor Elf1
MKNALDSATIDIPCPHCGKKSSETIRRLKTVDKLTCCHCHASFELDASDMRRQIAQVENQLAQLSRKLGSLGK